MPVDVQQALDLKYNHNLSYGEIAKIQGVSPQAVQQKISKLLPIPETKIYIDKRADILAEAQRKVVESFISLDETETKDMILRRGLIDFGILYDKERLERGQSTNNVASIITDLEQLRAIRAGAADTQDGTDEEA